MIEVVSGDCIAKCFSIVSVAIESTFVFSLVVSNVEVFVVRLFDSFLSLIVSLFDSIDLSSVVGLSVAGRLFIVSLNSCDSVFNGLHVVFESYVSLVAGNESCDFSTGGLKVIHSVKASLVNLVERSNVNFIA